MTIPEIINQLRAQIAAKLEERNTLAAELGTLREATTTDEVAVAELRARKDAIDADIDVIAARATDLEAEHARDEAASRLQVETFPTGARVTTAPADVRVGQEPRTYTAQNDKRGTAFLRDVMRAHTQQDFQAMQRLDRHMVEERVERAEYMVGIQQRDVGTSAFAGLTVPQYLTDMVAPTIRKLRPFADICRQMDLPAEGMTVNISRITTSTAVAAQASEAGAVQETDIDDTLLTVNVRTIAGQQDVSRQVVDRTTGGDQVVIEDLIGAYHEELDRQILVADGTSGTHLGIKNVSANVGVTYTDADPTAAELHPKLANLLQQISSGTNDMTDFIFHTRRWWWLASQLGSTFPLVTVNNAGVQQVGSVGDPGYTAMNRGYLGAGVVLDRNVETTLGAGTEDAIYGVNRNECFLWEDAAAPLLIRAEQTGAGNLMVKFVVYGYSAFTAGRYPLATGDITGTGLIAPVF